MIKVVSVEEMRAIEAATDAAGVSYAEMMQQAGSAVAEVVRRAIVELPAARVLVLVGPGNNGGDGLVAARILMEDTDARVDAYLLKPRDADDDVYAAAVDAGVTVSLADDDKDWETLRDLASSAVIVVDALLGTGARLPVEGTLAELLEQVGDVLSGGPETEWEEIGMVWPAVPLPDDELGPVVIAVDCPSGLDCDTGEIDPVAIPADLTVTFAAAKYGQLIFPGAESVGELIVADIGTPPDLPELADIQAEMATGSAVSRMLPQRPADSHKGSYGTMLGICGSANYVGAVALLGEAAYRIGAGLVTLAIPATVYPMVASRLREATWILLPQDMGVLNATALEVLKEEVGDVTAVLVGPGLGQEESTEEFIRGLFQGQAQAKRGRIGFVSNPSGGDSAAAGHGLNFDAPMIIDADGLNNLAKIDEWWKLLPENTVITPHPGEMARLAKVDASEVQSDRFGMALEKAKEWNCVVVLKGAHTLIASPEGRITAIPFATDALATAGTGDVLSGCIAGLLAQGVPSYEAAVAGAYIHGAAGRLAGEEIESSRSVVAGDVLDMLPAALSLIE